MTGIELLTEMGLETSQSNVRRIQRLGGVESLRAMTVEARTLLLKPHNYGFSLELMKAKPIRWHNEDKEKRDG